eukprot:gene34791-biopygen27503
MQVGRQPDQQYPQSAGGLRGGDGEELWAIQASGIFNSVDPTSHKRMDLVVHDPGKPNQLYDLVITNPVTQEVLQSNKVNLQATTIMQRIKERRAPHQPSFYPGVVEEQAKAFRDGSLIAWGDKASG